MYRNPKIPKKLFHHQGGGTVPILPGLKPFFAKPLHSRLFLLKKSCCKPLRLLQTSSNSSNMNDIIDKSLGNIAMYDSKITATKAKNWRFAGINNKPAWLFCKMSWNLLARHFHFGKFSQLGFKPHSLPMIFFLWRLELNYWKMQHSGNKNE